MGIWEEGRDYKFVAASQTKASLGPGSRIADGDVINILAITPLTSSPGQVILFDGAGDTGTVIFQGGASSVNTLATFYIEIHARAKNAAANASGPRWLISTGASVQVIATGTFH